MVKSAKSEWTLVIDKNNYKSIFQVLKSILSYKDLLFLFVKRDFISQNTKRQF